MLFAQSYADMVPENLPALAMQIFLSAGKLFQVNQFIISQLTTANLYVLQNFKGILKCFISL